MALDDESLDDGRDWITGAIMRKGGAMNFFSARYSPPEVPERDEDYECESHYSDPVQQDIPGIRTDFDSEKGNDEESGPWDYFMNSRHKR